MTTAFGSDGNASRDSEIKSRRQRRGGYAKLQVFERVPVSTSTVQLKHAARARDTNRATRLITRAIEATIG